MAALALTSCDKNKIVTIKALAHVVTTDIKDVDIPESFEVVFTNYDTKTSVTATTVNDTVSVSGLTPGIYTVTATALSSVDGKAYNFSGSATNVSITVDGQTIDIKIAVAKSSAFIFKEMYWTGDTSKTGSTYFRDQYYEIYNNSESVAYADGLCICAIIPMVASENTYSWTIDNPENYVFAQVIWQLPGDGTQYPVKPGESFIIAQWGVNHTTEDRNPESGIDLSGAEFEAYVGKNPTLVDADAINMNLACNANSYMMPQWLCTVNGSAYVLFYPSTPIENDNFIADANSKSRSRQIAIDDVLDAVEFVTTETDVTLKRLPSVLDAGCQWADEGSYSNQSFYRKTVETREGGQVVYQDTNNSTNDFEKGKPAIRRNNSGVPSWNTWIKK